MQYLLPYLKGRKYELSIGLFFVLLSTALDQVSPFVLKEIIDSLSIEQSQTVSKFSWDIEPYNGIKNLLLVFLAASIASAILLFFQRYLVISASRKAEYEIRNDLFTILQNQSQAFFNKHSAGDLMTRSSSDLNNVRELIGPVILHFLRMFLLLGYTAIGMAFINPWLAMVALSSAILLPLVSMKFMKTLYKIHSTNQKHIGELNSYIQEAFSGISIIRSFGKEHFFSNEFNQKSENFKKSSRKIAFASSMIWPSVSLMSGFGLVATIFVGSWMKTKGYISIGELSAIILFLIKVQFPLVGLGWVLSVLQRGRASLDRILDMIKDANEHEETAPSDAEPPIFEKLELKNVNLQLPDSEENLLSEISLELTPGKSIGIVGPLGSGKTLLTLLMSGILPKSKGDYLLNGNKVSGIPTNEFKKLFSLVPQDGFLFSESIRYNIELGGKERKDFTVENAIKISCLRQDLPQLKQGLDTLLGEKGINLSGGQKQRVALSRALMSNSQILILDDTLSALDTKTENQVLDQLKEHLKNRASIIVAHRYSSVKECDEILFLDQGKVIERGNFDNLISQNGRFKEVWEAQSIGLTNAPSPTKKENLK
jgi:ATP-binding cassette, subfamily B, multidrug efflux pump